MPLLQPFTLDVYSHILPTMQQEAKEAMDAILWG